MSHTLINKMVAKPGKRDALAAIMLESGTAFSENPNCLLYLVTEDVKNDALLWIQDVWTDKESHGKAMNDKTMQEYVKLAMPLLEGMPEQTEVRILGGKSGFTE